MANLTGQTLASSYDDLLTKGSGATPIQDGLGNAYFYEEGTWAPVYEPTSGTFTAITMDVFSNKYIKIGNLVHINAAIRTDNLDTTGGSGILKVTGLPYTSGSQNRGVISIAISTGWGTGFPVSGFVQPLSNHFTLLKQTSINATTLDVSVSDMTSGSVANANYIVISGTYFTS